MAKSISCRLLGLVSVKDIRFWIFLFFVIRLYGITNPPLEVAHNWRQTTVTMVARNFYETDSNILYPRVDFAGDKTGITGMEFPLLNYLIYLFSAIFGYTHWYGRLINLVVSSIGIYYFYLIIKRFFDDKMALYSSLILLTTLWLTYSRKIMPDTFSVSLVIAGFYYGMNYLTGTNRWLSLLLYFILSLAGILSKIPAGYILIFYLLLLIKKDIKPATKVIFGGMSILMLLPVIWWYYYWIPQLVERYGFWHFFMGKGFSEGLKEIMQNAGMALANVYDASLKFTGFALFLFGLLYAILRKERKLLLIFILGFAGFLPVVLKGGFTFAHHSYYMIPFIPVMALVCGYGLNLINNRKIIVVILVIIAIENMLNRHQDFHLKEKEIAIASLEPVMDKFSASNDLIVINSGEVPTPMYFAHRRGWLATNDQIKDEAFIKDLKKRGCLYVIILKEYFGTEIFLKYELMFSNKHYSVYKL